MALVRVTLPDDLVELLTDEAMARQSTIDESISGRLHAAIDLDPQSRGFVVAGATLNALEKALQGGALKDPADLLAKVRRLGSVRFGAHHLELTIGQMEEIARRARHEKKTVEQALDKVFKRMTQEFFRYV